MGYTFMIQLDDTNVFRSQYVILSLAIRKVKNENGNGRQQHDKRTENSPPIGLQHSE